MFLAAAILVAVAAGPTYKCKDAQGVWSESACTGAAAPPPPSDVAKYGSDKSKWVWKGRSGEAAAQACVEDWRPIMKDPESAQLGPERNGLIMESANDRHIVVPGRARNGFGGLGVHWFVCRVNLDGSVVTGSSGDLTSKSKWIEDLSLDFAYPRNR
jgi:hypothetical protein